ncbi:MAG: hypothetical protein LKH04_09285 [Lachnospiraceae bacterium]|jgi:hypothetical protein|nr:hypothetical protein [Lachnospiraceae bacterium]MCI1398236.1 hypothetical protein [Lachnospiraceae bacterium]MCI1424470.1 hypothetical protein [Lachnospiraceae bacterium]MCI1453247.1 hypothetical protein [Lachnospiraceae bacterium]
MDLPMYNYESRKHAFVEEWQGMGFSEDDVKSRVIRCSDSIEGSYRFVQEYVNYPQLKLRASVVFPPHLGCLQRCLIHRWL